MSPETPAPIGFGCAGLFSGSITATERSRVLAAAYDSGIRHYDLAPIYGLGKAEPEFASFLARHPDITVTTKFGLSPTPLAKGAALVQQPIRAALARSSAATATVQSSGQTATSGLVGRLLYKQPHYTAAEAKASLERSLRLLRTDRVDFFLLHEAIDPDSALNDGLVACLRREQDRGRIGAWGTAGELAPTHASGMVVQTRGDALSEPNAAGATTIWFGALSRLLPAARAMPALGSISPMRLAGILLRGALDANPDGVVLFTTSKAERVAPTVEAAAHGDDASVEVLTALRDRLGSTVGAA